MKIPIHWEREEFGAGKKGSWVNAGRKLGRERVSLLLSALVLTPAKLGFAPAQYLLAWKNSEGTR